MVKRRWRQSQRAIEQKLPGGGAEQVGAADYFGDSHRIVIHDDRQLISGRVIIPPDDKISKILSGNESLSALPSVLDADRLAVRHPEAPVDLALRLSGFARG